MHKIICYLRSTRDKDIIFQTDVSKVIECYVNAGFAGGWNSLEAANPASVFSQTGYVIMYCGYPLVWVLKLQTEIALSTNEAKYIARASFIQLV